MASDRTFFVLSPECVQILTAVTNSQVFEKKKRVIGLSSVIFICQRQLWSNCVSPFQSCHPQMTIYESLMK